MLVYYVPGFMGSELSFDLGGTKPYFVDPVAIATNSPLTSALAPDGTSPAAPGGQQLYATSAFNFDTVRTVLNAQLPELVSFVSFPWDWRQSIVGAATSLAESIQAHASSAEPANLICHSAGGLVAAIAYRTLAQQRDRGLVRRVVMMGSPLQGSYATQVALLPGSVNAARVILQLGIGGGLALLGAAALVLYRSILFSWPGFVELFPQVGGTDAIGDPARSILYLPQTYPDLNQTTVASQLQAAMRTQQFVTVGARMLADDLKVVRIASPDLPTFLALKQNATTVSLDRLIIGDVGDLVVTAESTKVKALAVYYTTDTHSALPVQSAVTGRLAAALLLDQTGAIPPGELLRVVEVPMAYIPVTSLSILNLLNELQLRERVYTVVCFTGASPTAPFVFGQYRSQRQAFKQAIANKLQVGGVYSWSGTAWFYVPSPKIPTFFV